MEKQIIIKVYGMVQGVFFRQATKEMADSLGLSGYVENLRDGGVKIVGIGDEEKLKKLLNFAKKGPPSASVDKIEVEWEKPSFKFVGFEVRY